jgi:hypothetical protein
MIRPVLEISRDATSQQTGEADVNILKLFSILRNVTLTFVLVNCWSTVPMESMR